MFAPGEPRPRVTAKLSGPLVDLSELVVAPSKSGASKPGTPSPALAVDVDADLRFDRLVLPDRRSLGPISGVAQLNAGALALKQVSVALDGASVTVSGTVGDASKFAPLDLQLNVEVTRAAGLAAFTGLKLGALPAFTASARLTDVTDGYALSALKLASAAATMSGDVALTRGPKRLKLSTKLKSALLDVSALAQPRCCRQQQEPRRGGCTRHCRPGTARRRPARRRRRSRTAHRQPQVRRRCPARPGACARIDCRRPTEGRTGQLTGEAASR